MDRTQHSAHRTPADFETCKTANIFTDAQTGSKKNNFRGIPYNIHRNLSRVQSSVAMQLSSEHIGLNSYLHRRKVPGVDSPKFQCEYPWQNVKHMVLARPQWARGKGQVLRLAKDRSFEAMMSSPEDVARITQWILTQGWIEQFRLAGEVEKATSKKNEAIWKGIGRIPH
ncbi:hypothetical protein K3495_g6323 [Podosphaera aphanis]|nr:hypothetical protein K3495_g6323 [Podosphaera aphanis]